MATLQASLSDRDISWLQELIQANIDSRDGFSEAAANLRPGTSLATLFARLSRHRGMQAEELQDLVAATEEMPKYSGTLLGAAERIWMDLRAAFGGGEAALLAVAEAGEERLLQQYNKALSDLHDYDCAEVLRKHVAAIRSSHEKLQSLKENCDANCS